MEWLARAAIAVSIVVWLGGAPAAAAGFQYGTAPDPDDKPIELGIWYPSDAPVSPQPLGPFTQQVALYAAIAGTSLPLIVISHGTGGGAASYYDTALALADAGFVVVTLSHTGDSYKDRSYSFTRRNFIDRPRHVSRVLDFMLNAWDAHDRIAPARIGAFGHSAGGTTVLTVIGGNPDFTLAAIFCRDHPEAWDCMQGSQRADPAAASGRQNPAEWHHDPRVKAAAIAAPAVGYAFTKDGLAAVILPVQLWRAEKDRITPNQWNADVIATALPTPPENNLVANAGHFDFLAPCSEALAKIAPEICESEPGFDRAAFHRQLDQALVDYFKAKLAQP